MKKKFRRGENEKGKKGRVTEKFEEAMLKKDRRLNKHYHCILESC